MSKPDDNAPTQPAVGSPLDGAVGRLQPERVNNTAGDTPCTVRWMVETPAGWLGAYDREPFAALVQAERDALRAMIADDSFAATFQTMGQYRTALLRVLLTPNVCLEPPLEAAGRKRSARRQG